MEIYKIDELKGGEILASSIFTVDYQILLSEGSIIKEEHITKLKKAGIEDVFVKAKEDVEITNILRQEIKERCHQKVKDILERHTYHQNEELEELRGTAEEIVLNILDGEPEIVARIYDIKERTPNIYEHSITVCSLSILTALKMKVDRNMIYDIGVGSLIHDLGLRYINIIYEEIDINILPKKDISEYKKHPVYAYSSISQENWISERSKNIVLMHHEHVDGTGFPLKMKEVPIECRIVNICDTFDEMVCGIGYDCLKVHEVINIMKKNKNTHHDGDILEIFLGLVAVFPAGCLVKTNEGELGIVIGQNKDYTDKPYIKIIKNKKGDTVIHDEVKDLSKLKDVYVVEVVRQ